MKRTILNSAIALIAILIAGTVSAQSPRLKKALTVTDNGLTFTICYDISGLGNVTEVQMSLTYDATVFSECFNPGEGTGTGDGSVPGQNKVVPANEEEFAVPVHNGRAIGCYTTTKAFTPGKCPNNSWTGLVVDCTFSNISLTCLGRVFTAN
jgi:hypothetical protein